jgi:acyl dehydratase
MEHGFKGKRLAEFSYPVERCKIREMSEAIGDPNVLYTDPEAARVEGYEDVIAPPTFGTCVGLWGGPGFPDLCRKLGVNPIQMLHAEHEYQYLGPIYPGDILHATIELADVYTKEGRSGRMKFYVVETTCMSQSGEKVLISRATLLERA